MRSLKLASLASLFLALSLGAGEPVRLTSSPDDEFVTGWSVDGRELALHVYQGGNRAVRVMSADSTMVRADGPPEPMMMPVRTSETSVGLRPESWIACSIAM